ncbi:MAG: hypothetical protein ACI4DV_02370 [Lachnospiraceae bacterium]
MPHINRIRVNNVKYNFGTQYYDDFVMRFSGKNTIYDLANGGGKSVLMLLLLQNLIPNCTLDEKQPIEKLFRSGNGNTTIHSLIEWKLNPCHVKNGFQYMTTGFCARKAKGTAEADEGGKETASVDYFNYCIFYRQFNDNDMKNLPLSDGKERITYLGLRSYLQELEKKDFHVEVRIFDRKGDYQRFISRYGLFESEWEIIRGINKTEGHVRTYFETNYRTTRKVVEDLLIEEIIEKSFYHKTGTSREADEMANTLLDLKDQLVLLSHKKNEMHYYDRQIRLLSEFASRVGSLQGMYAKKQGLEEQLVKTYNTTLRRRAQKEHAHGELIRQSEELAETRRKTAGQIDTAKIQQKELLLKNLERETERVKNELYETERLYEYKNAQLEARECDNYYLSYLENEKEYLAAREAVAQILGGSDGLEEELFAMAKELGDFTEEEQNRLTEQIGQLQQKIGRLEQERTEMSEKIRQMEISAGVLSKEEQFLKQKKEELQKRIGVLAREENILFFSDLEGERRRARTKTEKITSEQRQLFSEKEQRDREILTCNVQLQECAGEEKKAAAELEKLSAQLGRFASLKERMEHLIRIYGGTFESVENILFQQQKELVLEHQKATEEQKKLRDKLRAYAEEIPAAEPKELHLILEEISRYYDSKAVSGFSYIKQLDREERTSVLSHYPMLPYAVVTSADLYEIANDQKFKEKDFGDLLIPVISKQALEKEKHLNDEDAMIFVSRAMLKDEVQNRLKQLEEIFAKQYEKERVLKEDYDFIQTFLQLRREHGPEQEAYDAQKAEWKQLQNRREELSERIRQNEEQNQRLEEAARSLEEELKNQQSRAEALERVRELEEASALAEKEYVQIAERLEEAKGKIEHLKKELSGTQGTLEQTELEHGARQQQLRECMKTRDTLKGYLRDVGYQPSGLSFRELEAAFLGKKSAYEQKNTDISDKQKLADSFESAMNAQKEQLQLRGKTLEELKKKEIRSGCMKTGMEDMLVLKQEVFETGKQKIILNSQLRQLEEQLHKTVGSIQQAKQTAEEKYGALEPFAAVQDHLELFIEQQNGRLRAMEEEGSRQEASMRQLEEQCYTLKAMAEDMERMMRAAQIQPGGITDCLETGMSLKEQYEDLRNRYEQIVREEGRRLETMEKEKQQLSETLEKMGAYELSAEIKKNLTRPENERQIQEQTEALHKVTECLELEKNRIEKDMESLQDLKDRFEAQCLQNCLNMKEELDRLPKLSKISMDNRMISMITLQIPYLKEELYADAMSDYIDRIIRQVENYETQAERLNFIRNQLAFKRLFSVIVTNMDAIRLTLYKRERMKEQSRYLRYEEAVGSTGQSQGIYIQFLVAIINYISSINSGNADPLELKKVIFIDNPFGAAKDIYIWEPIFALLKANNVQLIVPARGATPAITGHFEVNYILGQKLINGRQQTVVTDYRSQTEETQLEYETLNFEQETLFSDTFFS